MILTTKAERERESEYWLVCRDSRYPLGNVTVEVEDYLHLHFLQLMQLDGCIWPIAHGMKLNVRSVLQSVRARLGYRMSCDQ